jgi:amino acid adenylation domain-containing protein/thioester reductase-like protein
MPQGMPDTVSSISATRSETNTMVQADWNGGTRSSDALVSADVLSTYLQLIEQWVERSPGGMADVKDVYPLSPLQHGILFHHIENEGRDTYVLSIIFSARSRSQIDLLATKLQEVIDRYDVLRTAVIWEGMPEPLQVVYEHVALPIHHVMLLPDRDPVEQLREQARSGRYRFDLQSAPLVRLWIAQQQQESEWYAVFQVHHMVSDHLSLIKILTEVAASLEGRERRPAVISFKNHVARALLHTSQSEAETFFRRKLEGIDSTTAPFGLIDARVDGSRIQEYRTNLNAALTKRVRTQAARYGISPGRLFHSAWALVVAHTSGRDDVVFGTVLLAAEQRARGTNDSVLLGPCINTLPLRLSLREVSIAALVERTSRELRELLAHDAVPLTLAQRCSEIRNGSPLFTSLFNFRRGDSQYRISIADDVGVCVLGMTGTRTGYPITVSVNDFGDGFEIISQVDQRLNPQRVASYMEAAMSSLTDALDANPRRPALELSVLPEFERDLLLSTFNDTGTDYPRTQTVHHIFEQQAAQAPDAPAISADTTTLSYSEVNRQANQLARLLIARGTVVGEYIPVLMHRCATMIIAQLAILKCGCVYVPVDPDFPIERLSFIFRDCGARRVLMLGPYRDAQPADMQWIDLSAMQIELPRMSEENLDLPVPSSNPAYVMYTSGSTGAPKGVAVHHNAVVRLVINSRYIRLNPDDCLIHYSHPAFDASTFEIWGALLNGARLVVVPQTTVLDPALFKRVLVDERVSVMWMTVGLFNQYAEPLSAVLRGLRCIMVGGDILDPKVIRHMLTGSLAGKLLNAYGPTECTTFTTTHHIREIDADTNCIPIGAPIANAQVYVLDARLQVVPIGVGGELYIGGDGVANGYLNRPELTAERFVADPFGPAAGKRLYRTGDLARWRSEGVIEFLGRNDHQVKIRGFRVELGEIQACVEQSPEVKEAVVVTTLDKNRQKQIICYLSARNPLNAPTIEDLREHVRATLPHYMVPSAFVVLDKLPLNANGKVDRRALPAPELSAYDLDNTEAPRGEYEELLSDIWKNLLGLQRIGRHENFFELGAHSLHVLQLLMRIKDRTDVPISVKDVYNFPTTHELAKRLRGKSLDPEHLDLQREAILPRSISPIPGACTYPPRNVFVTGSTGFVGRFLLTELLRESSATVYCLLRCQSEEHGFGILRDKLSAEDLWRDEFTARIVAVPGDLRRPSLGIEERTYQRLSQCVDSIYHCATSMNHLETYAMAKPANVGGAIEILRLATRHRPKLVNYMSTASVFSATTEDCVRSVNERSSIDQELHPASRGYAASKWVGEKIFQIARERGIPCNIFRLGLIWADTKLGRYDELQRDHRIFKSCILSGFGIKHYVHDMPPTPVDYAAKAILHLAGKHPNGHGIFHISSSSSAVKGVFERCNELLHLSLKIVPLYDWIREIKHLNDRGISMPVVPLVEYAFSMDEGTFHAHRAQSSRVDFDAKLTHAELEQAGIIAPALDDHLLQLFVRRMLSTDEQLSQVEYLTD